MRYRLGKQQIKMLLDGKVLKAGKIGLFCPEWSDDHTRLKKLYNDPEAFEKKAVFTDGVEIFVEDKG